MNPPAKRPRPETDLLVRAPASARLRTGLGSAPDPAAQLEELADLCERGWLSPEELAQHKAEVLAYYRET